MNAFKLILGIISMATLAGCSGEEKKTDTSKEQPVAVKQIQEPFRFHKAIEVKPGLTFDVVSWGRGSELVGGLLILRSDSSKFKYRSVSNELDGRISDAWNMDMDSDGNPEIFVQTEGDNKESFLEMYVYEFNDSGSSQELRFPELSSSTRRTYRGKDSVYIKDGNLYRQFPVFEEQDTAAVKPTGKKLLEYNLRGNSFSVKEIKE